MTSRVPARIAWALSQLALHKTERLLEIGCGAGHALAALSAARPAQPLVGIDRSAEQCRRARAQNAAAIAAGRVRVEQLALAAAPAALVPPAFAVVLAINVNEFWTRPEPAFAATARLLAPRGRLCLVYESPSAAASRQLVRELPRLAASCGFVPAASHQSEERGSRLMTLIARRQGG